MRVRKGLDINGDSAPQTRSELHQWIRDRMHLPTAHEQALIEAIDNVFMKHERLWQQSKEEAIQAVAGGFTDRLNACARNCRRATPRSAVSRGISRISSPTSPIASTGIRRPG